MPDNVSVLRWIAEIYAKKANQLNFKVINKTCHELDKIVVLYFLQTGVQNFLDNPMRQATIQTVLDIQKQMKLLYEV